MRMNRTFKGNNGATGRFAEYDPDEADENQPATAA